MSKPLTVQYRAIVGLMLVITALDAAMVFTPAPEWVADLGMVVAVCTCWLWDWIAARYQIVRRNRSTP